MTFTEHLEELRSRLLKCLAALLIGTVICFWKIDWIVALLTMHVPQLFVMKPAEAFMIYVKLALWSGAVLASPILAWQFWAFLLPAFTHHEKKVLGIFVPASVFLFLAGILFSFILVLPRGLDFLRSFASNSVQPLWSLESYLDFVILMVVPFGFFFNLPLILLPLAQMGLIDSKKLRQARRYVIVLSFVLAAVITPTTDMVSQTLLAVPIIALYEISLVIIRVVLKK